MNHTLRTTLIYISFIVGGAFGGFWYHGLLSGRTFRYGILVYFGDVFLYPISFLYIRKKQVDKK